MTRTTRGRVLLAVLLLVAGGVHLPPVPEHLEEAPYIGMLFIALAVACGLLAVAVLVTDRPLVWWASGVVCLLAVVAFVLSRTVGLPQIGDDVGDWGEPLGVAALVSESLVVLLVAVDLSRRSAGAADPAGPGGPRSHQGRHRNPGTIT